MKKNFENMAIWTNFKKGIKFHPDGNGDNIFVSVVKFVKV